MECGRMMTEPAMDSEVTVAELKEILREKGQSTIGRKTELVQRAAGLGPEIWTTPAERRQTKRQAELQEWTDARPGETEETGDRTAGSNSGTPERVRLQEEVEPEENRNAIQAELRILRREKELLERERQLLKRELELTCNSPERATSSASTRASTVGAIRGIRELLPEFDASENTFWRWRQQLETLRHTYHLDGDATRVLISSRLKQRALSWFHSKPEYMTLNIEDLFTEMGRMFDLRPGKLTLRREFEARVWKSNEPFCNYYHEKVILANRVPIAEDELLDYLIEGVTDWRLQSQARLINFRSGTEMLRAFESISLDARK